MNAALLGRLQSKLHPRSPQAWQYVKKATYLIIHWPRSTNNAIETASKGIRVIFHFKYV